MMLYIPTTVGMTSFAVSTFALADQSNLSIGVISVFVF